ncbi:hypothetical protein FRC04_010761 [Tulasnella sp. 424]|nr:hypothetical protein FRC04_010761 [Tulasnella sp. 424]KAG8969287.1 hypothetical protein FRC05_001147 [Tulasnella sp. 425]
MDNNNQASILTLPPEITVSILEYLLEHSGVTRSPYHGLLPVTQTSTHLRQTALSAPSLWSIIEINDKPSSFNFAKLCLSRSGNHKLDVSMRVLKKMESKINGLLALLEFASPRIRSLSLKLSFASPGQWDFWCEKLRALDLGVMESLTFEVWRREIATDGVPPPRNVIALPDNISSLRNLSLGQTSILPDTLALSELVRLTLSSASFWAWPYNHLFEVLQSCQALEELELKGVGLDTCHGNYLADSLPLVPRIQCLNLRRLTFSGVENNMAPLVLTNLTAPSLEVVSLEPPKLFKNDRPFTWANPPQVVPLDSVRVLLVTDGPTLAVTNQDHFALFLAMLFPEIERMEIASIRCRPLFVTWAAQVNIALNPWKELESIVLDYPEDKCVGHYQDILHETFRFLDARRKFGCPPVKRLRLGKCDECQYSDRGRVESGIKRLLRSKDALELVELTH